MTTRSPTDVSLLELAAFAKKALELAQERCSEANTTVGASEKLRDDTLRRLPRLVFLNEQLGHQIELLNQIVHQVIAHNDEVYREVETIETSDLPQVYSDLDNVFLLLKDKTVADELRDECKTLLRGTQPITVAATVAAATVAATAPQLPQANSPSQLSLFDFVDVDSIERLKQQTQVEMTRLKDMHSANKRSCDSLQSQVNELSQAFVTAGALLQDQQLEQLPEAVMDEVSLNITEQTRISEQMAALLISLGQVYTACMNSIKSSVGDGRRSGDSQQNKQQYDQILASMDMLDGLLQKLSQLNASLADLAQQFTDAITDHVTIFQQLDTFARVLRATLASIRAEEAKFNTQLANIKRNLNEFSDLVQWYDLFYDAYDRFIIEVDRRHQINVQYRALVDQLETQLRSFRAEEQQRCDSFTENMAIYLPPALHHFLRNPVPPAKIVLTPPQEAPLVRVGTDTLAQAQASVEQHELDAIQLSQHHLSQQKQQQ